MANITNTMTVNISDPNDPASITIGGAVVANMVNVLSQDDSGNNIMTTTFQDGSGNPLAVFVVNDAGRDAIMVALKFLSG